MDLNIRGRLPNNPIPIQTNNGKTKKYFNK